MTPYDFTIYLKDIKYKKIMTSEEISIAREKKRQEDLQFIVDSVNAGLTITQMRDLKPEFSYNEFTPMIKELIEAGVITQEQVDDNAKKGSKKTMNQGLQLSPEEQVQFILDKIRKGYAPTEIVNSDKTKSLTMHKVLYQKRKLIAEGKISQEEADRAMQSRQEKALARKHKKVINRIKEYTEFGYSLTEISEFITEYSYGTLSDIKNEYMKKNGWYTKEELSMFAIQRKDREAEEARRAFESLPLAERIRIEEERIAEARRLEEEKRKRREEIIAKRQAKKDETNKSHQEDANKLKNHLKNGDNMEKAAELMGVSTAYAYKIRRESIQNGTWLTVEEIGAMQEQKQKEKEKAKRKKARQKQKEQNRKKEEEQFRVKKEAWRLLKYREEGYTYKEISRKMNYSIAHLTVLRRKANEIFDIEGTLEEFTQLMKKEEEKANQEEQARLAREQRETQKAIKEAEELSKAFQKERKRKIKGYAESYKRYRKAAKKEDNLELDGEENVSTEGRKNFIDVVINLYKLDADIPDKDIEIILNTFYMHPEVVDKKSIKFLISNAYEEGGLKGAERMVIELANILRETKFYALLTEYQKWLKEQTLFLRIKELKARGMSDNAIGEKLCISSAEVKVIFYNKKKTEFPNFEDR